MKRFVTIILLLVGAMSPVVSNAEETSKSMFSTFTQDLVESLREWAGYTRIDGKKASGGTDTALANIGYEPTGGDDEDSVWTDRE